MSARRGKSDLATGGVKIRQAVEHDIARLREIERDAGEMFRTIGLNAIADDEPADPETLRQHVAGATAWVAERSSAVIGYALASIVDGNAHLGQVSVIRAAQGHGVGRMLIEQVEQWGREQCVDAVTLTTFADVRWNGPYYAHLGYEPVAPEELTPDLAKIRADETANGIDVRPRMAMRKVLSAAHVAP